MATYTDNGTNTPNGSHKVFTYTFPVLQTEDIKVALNGIVQATTKYTASLSPAQIEFNNNSIDSSVQESTGAPKTGVQVRVFRETTVGKNNGDEDPKAVFAAGSSIRAADLNANTEQALFAIHELQTQPVKTSDIEDGAITSAKIKDLTIVDADISATAEIEVYKLKDGAANQVLVTQNDGTTVNWSSNIDLPGTLDVAGNVDFDGNLDVDGDTNLDNAQINGWFVVTGTAAIDSVFIDGNTVETSSGGLTLNSTSGTTTVDDNLAVTGTLNVTQGVTLQNASATVNGSQIVTETASQTLTNKTLTTPVINDMSGTAVVTSGTSSSDTKVYSAKRAEERFYGKDTVGEIQSGETWSSADDKVATTAAIDARIIDLVDDVGGFVPIANETSFPTTNPDINTSGSAKGGTIVSVKTASTNLVPSGSTVTIANGRGSGLAVIITGVPSTIPSGFGFLVETTATDHTYAFHRLTPKATEVTTVATNATQVQTVHNNITQVQTVHNNITDIVAVANDATDIGAVAGKATEIGRLGTADAVADMAILGTADVVSDLNTLGTADVVADMNMLATSDVIADMNTLAVADVISDMDDLATSGNITAMSTCSTNIASINNCSTNISSVNYFGDTYQVANSNPSTDGGGNQLAEGDLYFNTSANRLKVYDGSSWVNGVEISGSGAVTTGNTFTGDNRYNDNVKALFGTGSDLEIFHSGTDSYIKDVGTGHLFIEASHTLLRSSGGENQVKLLENGAVELYYDNSKKLYTNTSGIVVQGDVFLADTNKFIAGNSSDLQIYHDGTTSYVSNTTNTGLLIRNLGNGDIKIKPQNSYPVELYYNGGKKFETYSAGVEVTGNLYIRDGSSTNNRIALGTSGDFNIYHDGSHSRITNSTGALSIQADDININNAANNEQLATFTANGAVELFYDHSKKLETTSTGVALTGNLELAGAGGNVNTNWDNAAWEKIVFDASYNTNPQGPNKIVLQNDNNWKAGFGIASNELGVYSGANIVFYSKTTDSTASTKEALAKFIADGGVELYYDNSLKLATASDKINFYADAKVNAHNTYSLGADGARWRNLYIGNNIYLPDAGEVRLGNSGDLLLYHNGSDSYIKEAGTGSLKLASDSWMYMTNAAGSETILKAGADAQVELYYDNSKKFETTSAGSTAQGVLTANQLSVTNGLTSTLNTNGYNLELGDSHSGIAFRNRIKLGADQDLQIYHYSGDNYINILYDAELRLTHGSDYLARFIAEGQNRFYYDNSTKAETTSTGFMVNGHLDLVDGNRIRLGSSQDLQIVHDGNNSYIEDTGTGNLVIKTNYLDIQSANGLEALANFSQDGVVRLYENSALKFQTGSGGSYGSVEAKTGKNGWSGYSIGGYYVFMANNEGNADATGIFNDLDDEWMFRAQRGNYSRIYYDGSEKVETTSGGAKVLGGLEIDGHNGNHTGDATLYVHANNNNDWGVIVDADSNGKSDYGLKVVAPTGAGYAFACAQVSGASHALTFLIDGDGNVDKSGHIYPRGNNSFDLGSTSMRWRNIHTGDLHLSNEGSSNDVDGSWGNWTMQEGESDLFLKNNRSGKKYKFNLTEVS